MTNNFRTLISAILAKTSSLFVKKDEIPHVIPPKIDITWDGDMTGRTALDLSAVGFSKGMYLVKITDDVFTTNDLLGCTIKTKNSDGSFIEEVIDRQSFDTSNYPGTIMINAIVAVVRDSDTLSMALGIPSGIYTNGVYFFLLEEKRYVSRLVAPESIKQLDEKFIPDTIARVSDIIGAIGGSY